MAQTITIGAAGAVRARINAATSQTAPATTLTAAATPAGGQPSGSKTALPSENSAVLSGWLITNHLSSRNMIRYLNASPRLPATRQYQSPPNASSATTISTDRQWASIQSRTCTQPRTCAA